MELQNKSVELEETNCNFCFCLSPSWARPLASRNVFSVCYGFLMIVQGMFFMFIIGSLTSIESHFQLPSETLGVVISVGEVTCLFTGFITGLIVTTKTHRPYGLAICLFLVGLGNNIFALPYYIYGDPTPLDNDINGTSTHTLCIENATSHSEECLASVLAPSGSTVWGVGTIFLIGQSISNIGTVSLYIIGTPFIDDNVQNKNSPMYLALMTAIRTVGPIFGFLLSTFCLKIYVNPSAPPSFDNRDSRWVGAWWLGNVIVGWLAFLSAFLIAQFPRRLPSKALTPAMQMELEEKKQMAITDQKQTTSDATSKNALGLSFKEMIASTRRIVCNWMLWLRTLSAAFLWFGLDGFMIFMPKYLEHEFHVTSSQASLWTGVAFLFPTVVGELIVGFLVQHYRPSTNRLAGIITITKVIEAIVMAILSALQCDHSGILGSGSSVPVCGDACNCSEAVFSPICGADGLSYYSACHAGCTNFISNSGENSFLSNCSCILNGGIANESRCDMDCPEKIFFLILVGVSKLCLSVDIVAGTLFILRCVEPQDKTIASGFIATVLGLGTFVPCPMVFSALVDWTCEVWGEQCGRTGACNIYDMETLRIVLLIVPSILIGISAFWDGLFWWFARNKVNLFQDN